MWDHADIGKGGSDEEERGTAARRRYGSVGGAAGDRTRAEVSAHHAGRRRGVGITRISEGYGRKRDALRF